MDKGWRRVGKLFSLYKTRFDIFPNQTVYSELSEKDEVHGENFRQHLSYDK